MAIVFILVLIAVAITFAAAFFYVSKIISAPPKGRAVDYLSRNVKSDKKIIACIGDSLTHGNIGQNWIDYLRKEFPNDVFLNEGINANTAWQVIQRLDPILQCQPDLIILLIGTNDALGSFDINSGLRYKKNNELPEVPTLKKYKEHLNELIEKIGIQSKIAICTLPPIGENVNSEVNKHVNLFNDYIKIIANKKNLSLLPVSDALWSEINSRTYPIMLDFNSKAIPLMMKRILGGIFHHYLFKKSWNDISRAKGQWILFDQIHLNERGAEIVYKLAKDFIAKS
ncbi:SGNH/GDSL hydrolase family protein [Candidatus Pseudothioglobus singularis]|nr:SGNH/GDSL hydrolase family protein [Candidatus Pseudothioglobus singularis]MDA8855232.1 SGNH/GDSL hydrolase family protein [Candidatus Pseudothioglobus singularis]MDC0597340.1 SGNH/GDSL hydrolase family protein [Candidatus Pseudothioglobus singularis]